MVESKTSVLFIKFFMAIMNLVLHPIYSYAIEFVVQPLADHALVFY